MAGVKGKSGGARPNTGGARPNSGGARPGAGRPRKPLPPPFKIEPCDMLTLLQKVALGVVEATPLQVRAAIAAVQYTHAKKADSCKKEAADNPAKKAAAGRFAPRTGPTVVQLSPSTPRR